jgi:hypothetical protein
LVNIKLAEVPHQNLLDLHQIDSFKICCADSLVASEPSKEVGLYKEHFKDEYFISTQTFDDVIEVIEKTERVILIISGQNGNLLVPRVHDF